jgi:hypothetical protein
MENHRLGKSWDLLKRFIQFIDSILKMWIAFLGGYLSVVNFRIVGKATVKQHCSKVGR